VTVFLWTVVILIGAVALTYLGCVCYRPDCICGEPDRTVCVLCPGCGQSLHRSGCREAGDCDIEV